ncbi:flagellar biosynthetic protein FliO [Thiomonas sp.]|jgi:flagellar protein FliO/FliZ|uniref:flagellar biosynthetic protein FliO n=1 Tax=Thiomonas sp. TaxID=2047785 RepID=UPI00261C50EA|nr:flagellar biosynthetic protein FliO [Thiomonas sp.]
MSDPLSWSSMLRVLAGLGLVLVVFYLLLRVLKRAQPGLASGRADFRVVASLALSPRERVLLVQVGEQQLLLGAGAQGLRCLHVLPQALEAKPPGSGMPAVPFADWLRKAVASSASSGACSGSSIDPS